jgi:late competence protein required for DNA uptake (superfamily II DNA/RNA helicase)
MRCPFCGLPNLQTLYVHVDATFWEWLNGLTGQQIRANRGNPTVKCIRCERDVQYAFQCPDCGIGYCPKCPEIKGFVLLHS